MLKVDDPEVRAFYQRSYNVATPPASSDEVLPFLFLNSLTAVCREPGAVNRPLSPAELNRATRIRLAFRVNLLKPFLKPVFIEWHLIYL